MRNLYATASLCALLTACAPSGSSPAPAVPQLEELTARQKAEQFFEKGPGAVENGGEIDTGIEDNLTSGAPINLAQGLQMRMLPVPGYPGVYNVTLRNTGSGYKELFVLQVPSNPAPGPRPLVVAFHRFGVSHADALLNTSFPAECEARGWYFVAPLGGSQAHFSSQVALINTRRVLDVVQQLCPIDPARVYGVGFSMGGGAALNYAARSLDPASLRFAAVVNHTGTTSTAHAFANELDDNDADDGPIPGGANLEANDWMEFWHGGTPLTKPFAYQQSSLFQLDPLTNQITNGLDLTRNLKSIKLQSWLAASDPMLYLADQTLAFGNHASNQGVDHAMHILPGNTHTWDTLDENAICNWFSGWTLQLPSSGSLVADGDGQKLYEFRIWKDQADGFAPFQWLLDPGMNRLNFYGTQNLKRVEFDAAEGGLAYAGALRINHSNFDGTSDELLLLNVPSAPVQVLLNGNPVGGSYDAQAGTFLLTTPAGVAGQWVVTF